MTNYSTKTSLTQIKECFVGPVCLQKKKRRKKEKSEEVAHEKKNTGWHTQDFFCFYIQRRKEEKASLADALAAKLFIMCMPSEKCLFKILRESMGSGLQRSPSLYMFVWVPIVSHGC